MYTVTPDARASQGAQSVIVAFVSVSVAFIVLALRLITRITIVRAIGPEDYVIIASLIFSIALSALICVEFRHGQGHHISTISQDDRITLFEALWASIPVYQMALTLTKLSILVQYWRVFVGANVRRTIITLFIVTLIYGIWSVAGTLFMCTPVSYFWNMTTQTGHCLDRRSVWLANASLNIITDLAIFILPMPVLHDLHLPRSQRLALMAVFGLGAFVCLTSILRLKSLYVISISKDVTWDNGNAAAWSSLEVNVGIICASLPTLRKTISRFFPTVFSSSSSTTAVNSVSRRPQKGGRGHNDANSGFKRFNMAQEASDWARTLSSPEDSYGAKESRIGSNAKIESGSAVRDDEDGMVEAEEGKIRVLRVTTQEVVTLVELKPVASRASRASRGTAAEGWGKRNDSLYQF